MKKLATLIFVITFLGSCIHKEPEPIEKIPDLTTEGKNTFGCLVNNSVWIPKVKCESWFGPCPVEKSVYIISNDSVKNIVDIIVQKFEKNKVMETIRFKINNVTTTGNYKLSKIREEDFLLFGKFHKIDTTRSGVIVVNFDTINRIISGKFNFISRNDSLIITNGIFDLKYEKSN